MWEFVREIVPLCVFMLFCVHFYIFVCSLFVCVCVCGNVYVYLWGPSEHCLPVTCWSVRDDMIHPSVTKVMIIITHSTMMITIWFAYFLYKQVQSDPIGALKCVTSRPLGNYDGQTYLPTNRPTNQSTNQKGKYLLHIMTNTYNVTNMVKILLTKFRKCQWLNSISYVQEIFVMKTLRGAQPILHRTDERTK